MLVFFSILWCLAVNQVSPTIELSHLVPKKIFPATDVDRAIRTSKKTDILMMYIGHQLSKSSPDDFDVVLSNLDSALFRNVFSLNKNDVYLGYVDHDQHLIYVYGDKAALSLFDKDSKKIEIQGTVKKEDKEPLGYFDMPQIQYRLVNGKLIFVRQLY